MNLKLHPKQDIIWRETRPQVRNLLFCGGVQSGKTTVGAAVSTRTAFHAKPEETLIIAAPTYKILQQATLPKFLAMNMQYGVHNRSEHFFKYHWGTTVYFRTGTRPESMEGISNCIFVWLDEGGMVANYFYENCMGRVARLQGKILVTTTPYAMNWLAAMADETLKGKREDTLLVQLRSVDSPYFPVEEFERQKRLLDPRRFAMKYAGQFGKMQGLVFPELPLVRSQPLPMGTKYFAGLDWGHTDPFVLVVRAVTPDGHHYRVDEYYKTGMIASDMFNVVLSRNAIYNFERLWADPSRPEYIEELSNKGLPIYPGNNDIQLGIDKQTELIRLGKWHMFEDMNPNGKDEYEMYHYPEPKEYTFDQDHKEQKPVDAYNHGIDADRYVTMGILQDYGVGGSITPVLPSQRDSASPDRAARMEQLKKRSRERVL